MANKELFEHSSKKEFNFFLAMIPLTVMVITMLYAIVVLETDPHLPLIIGTITAAIVAVFSGFKFNDLEEMMYKGIRLAGSRHHYASRPDYRFMDWRRRCGNDDLLRTDDYQPAVFSRNNLYHLFNRFPRYRQLLVHYGDNRCSWNGNWYEHGN